MLATAAEINTACDGATAKNSHIHLLATGASDVTAAVAEINTICYGVTEKMKVWTYTHTVSSGEATANVYNQTITAVTLAKVRSISACYSTGTTVTAFPATIELTTTTNLRITGVDGMAGYVFSVVIMEAI